MAVHNESTNFDYTNRSGIRMVYRGSLDVHIGDTKLYGPLHGNLGEDDPAQVFTRAVEYGSVSDDFLHFSSNVLPSIMKLANSVGNPQGHSIYFDAASVRYRWLDLAFGKVSS